MRKLLIGAVAAVLLAGGCTVSKSSQSGGTSSTTTHANTATTLHADAIRAPGVTNDAIKVGVTYVDTAALQKSGLQLKLGDYKGSYQALIDDINAKGGIDGRKIQLVFAPIDPTNNTSAATQCLHLTEDENVFVTVGFFLNEAAVMCPLQTHDSAVIGGGQTPQLLEQAKAPWFTTVPGSEVPVAVVNAFHDKGLLTGKIAVFAHQNDADLMNKQVLPELEKLGVHPVSTAVLDAPSDDTAAVTSGTRTIAQRFKAAGATKVILVGPSGADWFESMANQSYKPQLLIADTSSVQAYLSNAGSHDYTMLNGAVEGGAYAIDNLVFDEPTMQACFKIEEAAGIQVPKPDPNDPNQKGYTGPEDACQNVTLLKAILEKAGKDLNYATFRQAGYELGSINIPGDPAARKYGPPPATDGSPQAHLSTWDPATKQFVPESS
jgi:ABC-type branched-subunit amino acid transport system substrate-binding protein